MVNKFTEEQYQKIVNLWETSFTENFVDRAIDYLSDDGIRGNDDESLFVALALANPKTREDYYTKYVEQEKRYVWRSKQKFGKDNFRYRLYRTTLSGYISNYPETSESILNKILEEDKLTESEVQNSMFDINMFTRAEV